MTAQLSLSSEARQAELKELFGDKLEFDKSLGQFTSYKTGGPAACFVAVESVQEVSSAVKAAVSCSIPFFLLGGGTNLLISDSGYNGLVIKVEVKGLKIVGDCVIESGAGDDLADLVDFALGNSLSGIEFAAGIVGSVGGAIYGNAGAYGGDIGSVISELTLVDRLGAIKTVDAAYARFGYRDSYLKESGDIIALARFRLKPGNAESMKQKVDEIIAVRQEKLPYDLPSAGCFFKNIPDPNQKHGKLAAGRLLEEVGAKQESVGGAAVSQKHANIIINTGSATSKEIGQLADKLKEKVYRKSGIMLEEEVIKLGEF